jgi:hypothetical protein
VDSALRHGRLVSPTRGVLLPAEHAHDVQQRAAAALHTQRSDAAVSHRSAAALHAWPWIPAEWLLDESVDVTVARDDTTRSSRRGLRRRIAAVPHAEVVEMSGLRVTSPARTAVDIARTEDQTLAVQLMDWLLTNEPCVMDDLQAVVARMVGLPAVRAARAAIVLARPGVDSPRETVARLQVVRAGLPVPDTCLRIEDDGVLLARGDLGYWRRLIWIEYDGWLWHRTRGVFASDRARDRWLIRRGWECFRLTDRDLAAPRNWLGQLAAAIQDAPARIAAMSPTRSPEAAEAHRLLTAGQ